MTTLWIEFKNSKREWHSVDMSIRRIGGIGYDKDQAHDAVDINGGILYVHSEKKDRDYYYISIPCSGYVVIGKIHPNLLCDLLAFKEVPSCYGDLVAFFSKEPGKKAAKGPGAADDGYFNHDTV